MHNFPADNLSTESTLDKGLNQSTLTHIRDYLLEHIADKHTCMSISEAVGLSKVTVRRYLVIREINRSGKAKPGKIVISILKNPMVIAAVLALTLNLINLRFPELIYSVIADIAGVTTTVSFISLGVSLDPGELK